MSTARPILLVDDNSDVLEVIAVLLESEGYSVVTAGNGADALAKLADGLRPALIILDLTMPVMDGWEFRTQQLADPALSEIPTIIYSAVGAMIAPIESMKVAGSFPKGGDFTAMLRLVADLYRDG